MKTIKTPRYDILIAEHTGMCFGVRQAIETTQEVLKTGPATILGQLAHNPIVKSKLASQGARTGKLDGSDAPTKRVIITAHGASDRDRKRWHDAGYQVTDTTCPLVKIAHAKLAKVVAAGFQPVIIGKDDHVEVRGLQGDFPNAHTILHPDDIAKIPHRKRIGIISQTTQPIDRVHALVAEVRRQRPEVEVAYYDTVCHPTKDRQSALHELCIASELIFAIGGKNSNNTAQLAMTARKLGCQCHHIEGPDDIRAEWLEGIKRIGVTAGTSTLDECLEAVTKHLQKLATQSSPSSWERFHAVS
ncbi:MAG: 4-hydroxy-3-methylbut-2-enyl diphosphate reductase [Akkermansiaceae bacterium]|jgi:4-hydroxy-3-methylbut-2-enyl diphosphate reductase